MRGLTAEEYATLTFAAEHSVEEYYPCELWSQVDKLIERGALAPASVPGYADDIFARFTTVTDAGRSALKIHRALMAMEGLGI